MVNCTKSIFIKKRRDLNYCLMLYQIWTLTKIIHARGSPFTNFIFLRFKNKLAMIFLEIKPYFINFRKYKYIRNHL